MPELHFTVEGIRGQRRGSVQMNPHGTSHPFDSSSTRDWLALELGRALLYALPAGFFQEEIRGPHCLECYSFGQCQLCGYNRPT